MGNKSSKNGLSKETIDFLVKNTKFSKEMIKVLEYHLKQQIFCSSLKLLSSHCTMAQVLKEMGNRKNQCFRAHFF